MAGAMNDVVIEPVVDERVRSSLVDIFGGDALVVALVQNERLA
jgi:hypothetical protein